MFNRQSRALLIEAILYGVVGVLNSLVDIFLFAVLIHYSVSPYLANIISFSCGAANSLALNKLITFRSASVRYSRGLILKFCTVTLLTLGVSQLAIILFLHIGFSGVPAKIMSVLATFVVGFVLNRQITFRSVPGEPS
jgi:putative flippase GtrA